MAKKAFQRGSLDAMAGLKEMAEGLVPVSRAQHEKEVARAERRTEAKAYGHGRKPSVSLALKDILDTSGVGDPVAAYMNMEFTVTEAASYEAFANRVVEQMELGNLDPQHISEMKEAFATAPETSLSYSFSRASQRGSSRSYLSMFQDAILSKSRTDTHIDSIVHNMRNYVIGRGVSYRVANSAIRDVLDRFVDENDWYNDLCREIYVDAFRCGELAILHIHVPDVDRATGKRGRPKKIGRHFVRAIAPQNILTIETKKDYMNILAFERASDVGQSDWYAHVNYFKRLADKAAFGEPSEHHAEVIKRPNKTIQWVRYGPGGIEVSGWPPLASVLRTSKLYEIWLYDRARRNHELAKVIWIKRLGKKAFESESTTRERRPPRGSIMLVAIDGIVDYEAIAPNVQADRAADDGKALLYSTGAPVSMPIHILDQRADAAVYASIRKAESPFAQAILSQQYKARGMYGDIFSYVLRSAVAEGELPNMSQRPALVQEAYGNLTGLLAELTTANSPPSEVVEALDSFSTRMKKEGKLEMRPVLTEKYPLDVLFAEIVGEDPLMQARTQQILDKIGVTSKDDIAAKFNLNYWVQRGKISVERAQDAAEEKALARSQKNKSTGDLPDDDIPGRPKGSRPGLGEEPNE